MTNKHIPLIEPLIKKEYAKAVSDQILTTWIGSGKKVIEFENACAKYLDRLYAVAVTSGTAALMCAIETLELPLGSNIAVPAYGLPAAANVVEFLGYNPLFVDINELSLCMSGNSLQALFRKRDVNAVIYVDQNGYGGMGFKTIEALCSGPRIPIIEDAACAFGQIFEYTNRKTGSDSIISTFSFSVPKIITTGQGGLITTNDPNIWRKLIRIRDQGDEEWRKTKIHRYRGVNFKFTDIQAALGLSQLNNIDMLLSKKKMIYQWYDLYLKTHSVNLLKYPRTPQTWFNVIRTNNCATLKNIQIALQEDNIESQQLYKPSYCHPKFHLNSANYPNATWAYNHHLYLPSSLTLTEKDIMRICTIINKY